MKTHTLYLSCHSAFLSHWLVSCCEHCLFKVCHCKANCGVCVREWNQTCCFSCQSVYHLLKCCMKLTSSGRGKCQVCMCYDRETDILGWSLSALLFQLIIPQVSTVCECILESFLSFSKQFRIPCEYIISLQVAIVTSINWKHNFVASKRDTLKLFPELCLWIKYVLLLEGQQCWL